MTADGPAGKPPHGGGGGRPARSGFIPALHGLRGLLAVWVLTFHAGLPRLGWTHLQDYGYLGVDMFFAMSGYVLMQAHNTDFAAVRWPGVRRFLLLRWWRTYPLWAVCLVIALAIYPIAYGGWPPPYVIASNLLLIQNWAVPGVEIDGPAWSLGVEWVGYLAFPLVAALIGRTSPRYAFLAAAALVAVEVAVLSHANYQFGGNKGLAALLRMSGGFLAGCALWRVRRDDRPQATWRDDAGLLAAVAAAIALLLTVQEDFCLPALFAAIYFAARPGPATSVVLESRWALFLGRISFALYLCHDPIVVAVQNFEGAAPSWTVKLLGMIAEYGLSFGLATLLCLKIEEPVRRLGRARVGPVQRKAA